MNWELFVGLRYLRSRRREAFVSVITIISTLSVLLGVMVLTVVLAVMTGFEEDLRARILGLHPHLRVGVVLGEGMGGEAVDLAALVADDPDVAEAAAVVTAQVMVAVGERLAGVHVRGVDLASGSSTAGMAEFLKEGSIESIGGRHPVGEASLPGLMIGRELARRLGVEMGEVVRVTAPRFGMSPFGILPNSRRFVVVALYDSGMVEYDAGLIYMDIGEARRLLDLGVGSTAIEARLVDPYLAPVVAARLNDRLGMPYWVESWTDAHRNVFAALKLEKTVYFLVLLLIVLVSAFTIVASLYMVVMEKRRDIAVLKTMGASDRSIALIFVCKGLLIGVLGTLSGVLLGYATCLALARYEFIDLPEGVFYVSTLPVRIVAANFLVVAAASVVICLGACLFPAWKAAKVVPVEVLRYE